MATSLAVDNVPLLKTSQQPGETTTPTKTIRNGKGPKGYSWEECVEVVTTPEQKERERARVQLLEYRPRGQKRRSSPTFIKPAQYDKVLSQACAGYNLAREPLYKRPFYQSDFTDSIPRSCYTPKVREMMQHGVKGLAWTMGSAYKVNSESILHRLGGILESSALSTLNPQLSTNQPSSSFLSSSLPSSSLPSSSSHSCQLQDAFLKPLVYNNKHIPKKKGDTRPALMDACMFISPSLVKENSHYMTRLASGYLLLRLGTGKAGLPINEYAHRLVLSSTHGPPLKDDFVDWDLQALHTCGNTDCLSPRHLVWGTAKENRVRDAGQADVLYRHLAGVQHQGSVVKRYSCGKGGDEWKEPKTKSDGTAV
jgi:HNH endonuclease